MNNSGRTDNSLLATTGIRAIQVGPVAVGGGGPGAIDVVGLGVGSLGTGRLWLVDVVRSVFGVDGEDLSPP